MAVSLEPQSHINDSTDKVARLPLLPLDVQIYVMGFLEPYDILRLRKTCKALYYATSQQIVWIKALRQICVENSIFRPTFPLERMTLGELEHACTAPYKWLSIGSKDRTDEGVLHAYTTRRLARPHGRKIPPGIYLPEDVEFNSVYLIPADDILLRLMDLDGFVGSGFYACSQHHLHL
ncbi:hypothetical protein BDZ97DRAFT_1924226 [Flammula alnicola]|nr:hypothetical protein BDZ97DRAFT_1924226 [Flammula alnicola]